MAAVLHRLEPLKQQPAPLRKRIIASLRHAIETGLLAPGVPLIEKELCKQLGVSRTSLREALRELHADGILVYSSSRSLTVSAITSEEAENVYLIRSAIEALIVEQFIEKINFEKTAGLLADSKALKEAYCSGDLGRMLQAKRIFYDRICSGAENPTAFAILDRLVLRISSLRSRSMAHPGRQQKIVREIETLVEAICRRDTDRARKAVISHVMHAAQSALGRTVTPPQRSA